MASWQAGQRSESVTLAGVSYDNLTLQRALDSAVELVRDGAGKEIFFLNLDCLRIAQTDGEYRELLKAAALVLPDGVGLRLATRLFGATMNANCNGSDFSPLLLRELAQRGHGCFFLGGRDGVAERAAKRVAGSIAGLRVVGTHGGYFTDDGSVVRMINASGAAVLFVALGVPRQEKWIARNRAELRPALCLGVGALFDYLSGAVPRAPRLVRALSLEWAWRVALEPRRMVSRYILAGLPFMLQLARTRLRSRST
jgi:exopolysaccharide biosynthesis WecB/TagA/CpsF family protein